jgi:hypothetical protein
MKPNEGRRTNWELSLALCVLVLLGCVWVLSRFDPQLSAQTAPATAQEPQQDLGLWSPGYDPKNYSRFH